MLVVLNTERSPIAIQADRIKAIIPNSADTACTITFSDTHEVEVVGSLAKIRGKLDQRPPAATAAPPQEAVQREEPPIQAPPSRSWPRPRG